MEVVHKGRGEGKTEELVEWVKRGVATTSYPYWSRVLLVHSLDAAQRIRVQGNKYGLDYNQVFALREWANARLGILPVEIAIDNVEFLIQQAAGQSRVVVISINQEEL